MTLPDAQNSYVWSARTFGDHFQNAVAWLRNGYGARLSEDECKTIVRVLWSRSTLARQTPDSRV